VFSVGSSMPMLYSQFVVTGPIALPEPNELDAATA
jgi:hypothetical protein